MRSGWGAALSAVAVVACSSGPATESATTAVTTTSTSPATYDQYYVSGGSTWFVSTRPLLPHEHGCGDVAAWWTTTVE